MIVCVNCGTYYDMNYDVNYYLALGTNMGDKNANLRQAVGFLETIGRVTRLSSVYRTSPVGMEAGTDSFYNMVLAFESDLPPLPLLRRLKQYEGQRGRDLSDSHNKPRVMDIDILLAGTLTMETEELIIPHKEMANRQFVMIPLKEIAPEVFHPILKQRVDQLAAVLETGETIIKISPPPLP